MVNGYALGTVSHPHVRGYFTSCEWLYKDLCRTHNWKWSFVILRIL